jgi:hypothetical protein
MQYNTIESFSEININTPHTLILCDIDETILKYDDINDMWWKNTISFHMTKLNSYEDSDQLALEEWVYYIHNNKPTHTDFSGFNDLLNKASCNNNELLLLTARNRNLEYITHDHLEHVGIDISKNKILFTNGYSKGDYIKQYIDIFKYNSVIFIDDNIKHLNSVYNTFGNKIKYYMFKMK